MNNNSNNQNNNEMNVNNAKTIVCPNCGAKFAMVEEGHECKTAPRNKRAMERIAALKAAGVDVSNMFAMTGADGGEYVAAIKEGNLAILSDEDPIFAAIKEKGDVPNRKLFRRWVMSQMFHMLNSNRTLTEEIRWHGYAYSWKMVVNEMHAQAQMFSNGDTINFTDRNRWFDAVIVGKMAEDFIAQLRKYVDAAPRKKCKGVPYVRIAGKNIFVSDLDKVVWADLEYLRQRILDAKTPSKLDEYTSRFFKKMTDVTSNRILSGFEQCKAWVDAYKGSGAFFTMQNLVRFHNCTFHIESGIVLNKEQSLEHLDKAAEEYQLAGWRMVGLMKKLITDNGIDIAAKIAEFSK